MRRNDRRDRNDSERRDHRTPSRGPFAGIEPSPYKTDREGEHTGVVRTFLPQRGFGFIDIVGEPAPMFFHAKSLRVPIDEARLVGGARVTFDIGTDKQSRPCAVNVSVESAP